MTREVTCPACGLVVAAGYPRCPRCRALLPGLSPAPGAATRSAAGGTAIADRRRPILLIVATAIAVAVAVVAVIILMSDDGDDDRAGGSKAAPAEGAAPPPADRTEAVPAGEPAGEPGVAVAGASAASLGVELDSRRLWATVDVDGQAAVVHSAYCADPGMDQAISAAAADLVAVGLVSVRCHERHGPLVFERPLRAAAPAPAGAVSATDAGA